MRGLPRGRACLKKASTSSVSRSTEGLRPMYFMIGIRISALLQTSDRLRKLFGHNVRQPATPRFCSTGFLNHAAATGLAIVKGAASTPQNLVRTSALKSLQMHDIDEHFSM